MSKEKIKTDQKDQTQEKVKSSKIIDHCYVATCDKQISDYIQSINGKFVNGIREADLRKGYLCLESEGAEIHFRKIQIMELPGGRAEELGMSLNSEKK